MLDDCYACAVQHVQQSFATYINVRHGLLVVLLLMIEDDQNVMAFVKITETSKPAQRVLVLLVDM